MKRLKTFFFAALTATLLHGGMANAAVIGEVEPNNSLPTAQSIDGFFTLDYSPDIGDVTGTNTSTYIPHVSIIGTGDGTYDYYTFTVGGAGTLGIFDIDYGMPDIDTEIAIWDSAFTPLAENDDYFPITVGAGGSVHSFDSFIQYLFASPGTYYVGVARFAASALPGGWTGGAPLPGDDYTLQISLGSPAHPAPEPSTMVLLGSGALGLFYYVRKRNKSAK